MKTATALFATAAMIALPQMASASSQTSENLNVCSTEIRSQIQDTATQADLDFKAVKGNSRVQTLTFRIAADGASDTVKCKVRRDDTVEIVWGKKVQPKKVLSVQAEAASSVGE